MSYATLQNLIDRFGDRMLVDLTDRGEVATGSIDTDAVNRALTDTDATIDGSLAVRYQLPLTSTPALIIDLAQTIAIYKLHTSAADPKIEEDFKQAMRTLKDISGGSVRLPVAGVEPTGTGGSGARVTDRERPMTADNMKGLI